MANRISVKVGGVAYSLIADEPPAYVEKLAERLNAHYPQEGGIPNTTAAILAGIAVADELTKLEEKSKETFEQIREYEAETLRLRQELAALKRELSYLQTLCAKETEGNG